MFPRVDFSENSFITPVMYITPGKKIRGGLSGAFFAIHAQRFSYIAKKSPPKMKIFEKIQNAKFF